VTVEESFNEMLKEGEYILAGTKKFYQGCSKDRMESKNFVFKMVGRNSHSCLKQKKDLISVLGMAPRVRSNGQSLVEILKCPERQENPKLIFISILGMFSKIQKYL